MVRAVRVPPDRRRHDGLHRPLRRPRGRWPSAACAGTTRRSRACEADLLLVTHEHFDHNGVGAIGGDPVMLRSTAGRLESPIGEVARRRLRARRRRRHRARPEHAVRLHARRAARRAPRRPRPDRAARGAARGARAASTSCFVPSAAGRRSAPSRPPRSPGGSARASSSPMHYRTERIDFLEPVDAFAERSRSASSASSRARSTSTRSRAATDRSSSCPPRPERRSGLQRSAGGPTPQSPIENRGRGQRRSNPDRRGGRTSEGPEAAGRRELGWALGARARPSGVT